MFLEDNTLPKNHYEEKILCPVGMEYQEIHACLNDCILYEMNLQKCVSALHVGYHGTKLRMKNAMMKQA